MMFSAEICFILYFYNFTSFIWFSLKFMNMQIRLFIYLTTGSKVFA